MPVAVAVNVTEHDPAASVHVVALKDPAAPVSVNVTVPVGVEVVPGDVSVTVAVQVEAWPTTTGVVHETAVLVVRSVTVRAKVPELVP